MIIFLINCCKCLFGVSFGFIKLLFLVCNNHLEGVFPSYCFCYFSEKNGEVRVALNERNISEIGCFRSVIIRIKSATAGRLDLLFRCNVDQAHHYEGKEVGYFAVCASHLAMRSYIKSRITGWALALGCRLSFCIRLRSAATGSIK